MADMSASFAYLASWMLATLLCFLSPGCLSDGGRVAFIVEPDEHLTLSADATLHFRLSVVSYHNIEFNITLDFSLLGEKKLADSVCLACGEQTSCSSDSRNGCDNVRTSATGPRLDFSLAVTEQPEDLIQHDRGTLQLTATMVHNYNSEVDVDVPNPHLDITVEDGRYLLVGFAGDGSSLISDSSASLTVVNFKAPLMLNVPLNLTVTFTPVSNSRMANKSTSLILKEAEQELKVPDLDSNTVYEAVLSTDMPDLVKLENASLLIYFKSSVLQQLYVRLVRQIQSLAIEKDELQRQTIMHKALDVLTELEEHLVASPPPAAIVPPEEPVTVASAVPNATWFGGGGQVMWAFLAFLAFLIVGVASYLLYNNYTKVKGLLCPLSEKSSTTSSIDHRHKRPSPGGKYTPLPTSLHDTVLHQD